MRWGGEANERLGWDRLQAPPMGTASKQKTSPSIAIKTKGICGMLFYPAWGQEPACIPAPSTRAKASVKSLWCGSAHRVVLHSPAILLGWELCFSFPEECSGCTDCSLDTASITVKVSVACSTVFKKKKKNKKRLFFFSFLEKLIFCSSFCMIL